MNLNLNFDAKTLLSKWWTIVRDNFRTIQSDFNGHVSEFNTAKQNLQNQITNEVSARKSADEVLRQSIETETNVRSSADTELGGRIDREASERKTADSNLSDRVSAVETKSHTHGNKSVLDGISEERVGRWDSKSEPEVSKKEFTAYREYARAEAERNFAYVKNHVRDAASQLEQLWKAIGLDLYDGGIFGVKQTDKTLDGGTFKDAVFTVFECGGFEPVMPFGNSGVMTRKWVRYLPTDGMQYEFGLDSSSASPFLDAAHCTESSAADGYLTIRSDSRSVQVKKARAIWRFLTDDMKAAGDSATVVVEFDTRVPEDARWHIALVNLDMRGGDTYDTEYGNYNPGADDYDTTGVAFWHGVTNSSQLYQVNGRNGGYNRNGEAIGNMSGVWIHTKAEFKLGENWIRWTLTNRDTSEVIDTASQNYTAVFGYSGEINGIELHTWTQTSVDIDNISVKAVSGIDRYRIFTKGTKNYIYNDNTPCEIG